jgi:hypothetical protein
MNSDDHLGPGRSIDANRHLIALTSDEGSGNSRCREHGERCASLLHRDGPDFNAATTAASSAA